MKGNNCPEFNGHRKSGVLKKCQLSSHKVYIAIASMIASRPRIVMKGEDVINSHKKQLVPYFVLQ